LNEGGSILVKKGLHIIEKLPKKARVFTYALEANADFYATNIRRHNNYTLFNAITPDTTIDDIHFGLPGLMNVENAMAAIGIASLLGVSDVSIRKALLHFTGVKRRFDIQIWTDEMVFIDDYAHHPEEIYRCLQAVKEMFPGKMITGIFQPHLFSRTRDFADEFANSLKLLDKLILLDIYPAREEPIVGITSELILGKVKLKNKMLCSKEEIIRVIEKNNIEVLITMGAGDIDKLVAPIKETLLGKMENDNQV
jgi:UDP-N-acetylmuramate--alanine ligase